MTKHFLFSGEQIASQQRRGPQLDIWSVGLSGRGPEEQIAGETTVSGSDSDGSGCAACTVVLCQLLVWWPQ